MRKVRLPAPLLSSRAFLSISNLFGTFLSREASMLRHCEIQEGCGGVLGILIHSQREKERERERMKFESRQTTSFVSKWRKRETSEKLRNIFVANLPPYPSSPFDVPSTVHLQPIIHSRSSVSPLSRDIVLFQANFAPHQRPIILAIETPITRVHRTGKSNERITSRILLLIRSSRTII